MDALADLQHLRQEKGSLGVCADLAHFPRGFYLLLCCLQEQSLGLLLRRGRLRHRRVANSLQNQAGRRKEVGLLCQEEYFDH